MAHILIVEDDADLAALLQFHLSEDGHEVRLATSGDEAVDRARAQAPQLVVLDLMLPGLPGLEVCRLLKEDARTRGAVVLVLTARGSEQDRIAAFEAGAEDYVTKPFSVRELRLRIRALLRRAKVEAPPPRPLALGRIQLDPVRHRCTVDSAEVTLTVLEFRLLHHLLARPGIVWTRQELLEQVWGAHATAETRTIDTHVMRLREKLGEARAYVQSVRGVGYRLQVCDTDERAVTDS